ncbi:MAG: hypothetical protein ACRCXZ_06495 [Patescibacteria group bacterium]
MPDQNLIELVQAVHKLTNEGKAIEAMELYYDENVVMSEGDGSKCEGLEANLIREGEFFGSIEKLNYMTIDDTFIDGDTVYTTSSFDFVIAGNPMVGKQISITKWKDGKVIEEKFCYKTF